MGRSVRTSDVGMQKWDYCVIGAGPAGLVLTSELAATKATVLLIESGSNQPNDDGQSLNAAEVAGLAYDAYESRARAFGGTMHLWAGRCSTYDPIDFETRSWVPHSGWPIGLADLAPHYERALSFLGHKDTAFFERTRDRRDLPLPADFETKDFLVLDAADGRLARRLRDQIVAMPSVTILQQTTVAELISDATGAVTAAVIADSSGSGVTARVTAKVFVLCAGGIETPRLLLNSRSTQDTGVGNRHDLVGRYFSDHPRMRSSSFLFSGGRTDLARALSQRDGVPASQIGFRLAATTQEEHGLLNHCVFFDRHNGDVESLATTMLSHQREAKQGTAGTRLNLRSLWRQMPPGMRKGVGRLLKVRRSKKNVLTMKIELQPNPDSRITLSSQVDRLGVPEAKLDWRVTGADREGLRRYFGVLKSRLEPLGLVDKELLFPDPDNDVFFQDSSHPLGTTRMGATAAEGVVDRDLKVFDAKNLYVCSSSVFPTAGNVNPTLTIIALGFRLAEHLSRVQARPVEVSRQLTRA